MEERIWRLLAGAVALAAAISGCCVHDRHEWASWGDGAPLLEADRAPVEPLASPPLAAGRIFQGSDLGTMALPISHAAELSHETGVKHCNLMSGSAEARDQVGHQVGRHASSDEAAALCFPPHFACIGDAWVVIVFQTNCCSNARPTSRALTR